MRIAEEELPVRPATREIAIISMMTAGIFSSKMLSRSFWNDGKVCTTEVKPTMAPTELTGPKADFTPSQKAGFTVYVFEKQCY